MAGVTDPQGMFTPPSPMHLIPPLVYPGVRVIHALMFVFLFFVWITRMVTVRHLCLFIENYEYIMKKISCNC